MELKRDLVRVEGNTKHKDFVMIECPSKEIYGVEFFLAIRKKDGNTLCTLDPDQLQLIFDMKNEYDEAIQLVKCEVCKEKKGFISVKNGHKVICDDCFKEESE